MTPDSIVVAETTEDDSVSNGSGGSGSPGSTDSVPNHNDSDQKLLDLANKTSYNIVQRNGQRIYGGPPPGWVGVAPEKGCEIFVGKVPRDAYEDELVPVFERVGRIYELRLMMDFSGSNRGFFFVRYTNREDAKRAVRELNNYEIRPNKYLGVIKSVDNRKLWISGIPKNRSAAEIQAEMERMTEGVRNVILYQSQTDKTKTRGYAFVEYESHRAAALARRKLVPGRIFLLGQEIEKVDWAEPENEVEEEVMKKVRILFIRNLMASTTEAQIRSVFAHMGSPDGRVCRRQRSIICGGADDEEVEAAEAKSEADLEYEVVERVKKSKDYAFVHFTSREAAERAMRVFRAGGLNIEGSDIEVTWSKPVDKQIYQTRKHLTKILSGGAPNGGNGGGQSNGGMMYDSPLSQLSPLPPLVTNSFVGYPRGIAPRRRGAAGIRGLGAPGTAPPRRLVKMSGLMNGNGSLTTPPPQHNGSLIPAPHGYYAQHQGGGANYIAANGSNGGAGGPLDHFGLAFPPFFNGLIAPPAHQHQIPTNGATAGGQSTNGNSGSGGDGAGGYHPSVEQQQQQLAMAAALEQQLAAAMYNLSVNQNNHQQHHY